jgi:hypothetical protein
LLCSGAAVVLILAALWWRQRLRDLEVATVVVAAVDPRLEAAGLSLHNSAQAYAARISPTPVVPYLVTLQADRAMAAVQADRLGDRVNEFVSIAQAIAPTARRINLVVTARNAAAFRIGQRITKNHRKEIAVHHGDSDGFFPAVRLAGGGNTGCAETCVTRRHDITDGNPQRGCLLVHIGAHDDGVVSNVLAACTELGAGFLVEVRHPHDRLPSQRHAFECVVSQALAGWAEYRTAATRGPSHIALRCPAVIALALGAQLAAHPDEPWIPLEWSDGRYLPFAPATRRG